MPGQRDEDEEPQELERPSLPVLEHRVAVGGMPSQPHESDAEEQEDAGRRGPRAEMGRGDRITHPTRPSNAGTAA